MVVKEKFNKLGHEHSAEVRFGVLLQLLAVSVSCSFIILLQYSLQLIQPTWQLEAPLVSDLLHLVVLWPSCNEVQSLQK